MKNLIKKRLLFALAIAAGILQTGNLPAAEIQGVTISAYSSQNFTYPSTATYSVSNLVSNVGLFGDIHCFVPGGAMWLSASGANGTNFVTFNLGGPYTLNAIKVWNYNDSAHVNYGVSNAAISYSTDGVNFTTNISSQGFNEAFGNYNPYAQTITLPSPVTAQYVRFNIKTNWGGGTSGVGLAKVRFISNTNPPTVLSASENYGSNQVTVIFSEPVNAASATNPANYSINSSGPTSISGVTMGEYADRVILSTSPLTNNNYSVSVSGVYDEMVTAAVNNNSTVPVQSELYLWLRADQGVTTTPAFGGNMLTTWNDRSTYGHNAQPANFFGVLTNQPFLAPGVVNGLPAVQFFGTNVMQIPNDPANPINGDMTLFMVLSASTGSGGLDPINKTGGGSSGTTTNNLAAPFDFYVNSAKPTFFFGNNGVSSVNIAGGAEPVNTFYVVALSVTGTNLGQVIINGSSPIRDLSLSPANQLSSFTSFGAAPWDAGNPICIGARNSGPLSSALPFNGYLPETMLIRGTITSNDLVSIDNYLAAKYNIAPPTITEQPASLTANAGSQATFWVAASGMQPFSYQWQSNGVTIPGATGMSYTTPFLTSSANSASYTVTVSNASGTVGSAAATLTVATPATPPTVFSAAKTVGLTNVLIVFSEAIDSVTGLNPGNYSIDNGASVVSAAAGSAANQVVLTTSLMNGSNLYHLTVQNVRDLYNNAIVSVTVPLMPASLSMWLRGDSGVVTNANASYPSAVDAWLDQTANGNNAVTYGVAAYRPSLGTDPVNGKPAVLFNSAAQNFLVAASSPGLAMTGDMSLYIVANFSDFSNYRDTVSKDSPPSYANSWDLYMNKTGGQMYWNRGDGTSFTHTATQHGAAVAAGQPVVMSIIHQGTGIQPQQGGTGFHYINGVSSSTTAFTTSTFGDVGSSVYIGMRRSMDINMNGDFAEIMVFSNAISGSDRSNIDNYLGAKYFALINSAPLTNKTANAGTTTTFTTACSQGSAHLTYQWQENSTNIPGANGPSYTTPPLSTSDNGDQFALLVIAGSVTNELGPVTLTVNSVPPVVQAYGLAIWSGNILAVTFQTALDPSIATNTANYILNNGATVLSATLVSPTEVLLTTSTLSTGASYTLTVQNLQDNFGSIMATTNLVNVTASTYPSVALWLQGDKGITASDGTVSEWDDQSGNGNDFFAAVSPMIVSNAINGRPAVQFNGTNMTFMYAYSSPTLAITNDMAILAVMNFTTYENASGALAGGGGGEIISKTAYPAYNQPCPYDYYVYYITQTPYFLRGNGVGGGTFAGAASSPSTGVWHELSATMIGSTISHRLDGHQNGTISWSGSTIADNGDFVTIGKRLDNGLTLTGEMAELIMVGGTLSTNDAAAIETYLGAKYGLINAPGLEISTTNRTAVVSWPDTQWSFILQSTPRLNAAAWSTVTNTPVLANGTNTVTIPISTNAMFYRLQSQ